MKKIVLFISALFIGLMASTQARAHSPLCSCLDNGDGTITCEGGFSDGSSASGVEVRVVDGQEKVLFKGKMAKIGEYTFRKPNVPFTFIFDAGPGHVVKIKGNEISK